MHAQEHATFDAGGLEPGARPATQARAVMPEGTGDAALRFVASDSGAPLAWRPYRLHIGGRLVLGRTDGHGCSAPLTGAERGQLTDWEVE